MRGQTILSETDLGIAKENVNKLYRILLLLEIYTDNKKILKQLQKVVKIEEQRLRKLRYPWISEDYGNMCFMLEDIGDLIRLFRKAKTVEQYNRAHKDLEELIVDLRVGLDLEDRMGEGLKCLIRGAKEKVHAIKESVCEGIEQVRELCMKKDGPSKSA